MKIAILGTGRQATTLARRMQDHDVVFGTCEFSVNLIRRLASRMGRGVRVASPKEAVEQAQVVLLAAPKRDLVSLLAAAGSFTGKLVLQTNKEVKLNRIG